MSHIPPSTKEKEPCFVLVPGRNGKGAHEPELATQRFERARVTTANRWSPRVVLLRWLRSLQCTSQSAHISSWHMCHPSVAQSQRPSRGSAASSMRRLRLFKLILMKLCNGLGACVVGDGGRAEREQGGGETGRARGDSRRGAGVAGKRRRKRSIPGG